MKLRLLAATLIFILAGLFQNTGFFSIFGIKPNLLLTAVIALSFFVSDFLIYSSFVIMGAILLAFTGGFWAEQLIFAALALAIFPICRYLRWQPIFNNLLLIGAGTILFYLLSSPTFLMTNWLFVAGELVYNLVWGVIFFELFALCIKTNSMLKI